VLRDRRLRPQIEPHLARFEAHLWLSAQGAEVTRHSSAGLLIMTIRGTLSKVRGTPRHSRPGGETAGTAPCAGPLALIVFLSVLGTGVAMAGPTEPQQSVVDPRPARKQARVAQILDAAWQIAHEQGLAGVALHEVARRVGLRQPSLYAYFDSKAGLYDLMYAQGYADLLQRLESADLPVDPKRALVEMSRLVLDFQVDQPARAQLLFLRTVPGFTPSPESYALALRFMESFTARLLAAGATSQAHVDIFTALVAGIANQQTANDPGGDRWTRHLDTVLNLYFNLLQKDSDDRT